MSRLAVLSDTIRALGLLLIAAKGAGKSRFLGRILLLQDAYREVPTILIDFGETINNFLSKLAELPQEVQERIWPRVLYVDMVGRDGYVSGFPLYYRIDSESLYQIAQRPLDVIKKADPYLQEAPIHGWNPLWLIGTHAGIILAALGYQIAEMESLLTHPHEWEGRLQEVEQKYPEAARSVAFFRRYMKWPSERRLSRTESLLIKAATFTLDPTTLAMFSASQQTINIYDVIDTRQIVLIDMSGVIDGERRRFMLMWLISYVMSFIKHRGPGHHHSPLSLVIDEFSLLTHDEAFSQELDEMINVYSRSHRLWLTIASQSIGQFSEGTQRALLSLGTQCFGAVPDMESALKLAQWFGNFDPNRIKYNHPIYMMDKDYTNPVAVGRRGVGYEKKAEAIDYRPEFSPLSEQEYQLAKRLRSLKRFSFLIRPAREEGTVDTQLYPITIKNFDKDIWVDPEIVEKAKRILRKRSGIPVAQQLSSITSRVPRLTISDALSQPQPPATLAKHELRNNLPPEDTDENVY